MSQNAVYQLVSRQLKLCAQNVCVRDLFSKAPLKKRFQSHKGTCVYRPLSLEVLEPMIFFFHRKPKQNLKQIFQ